MQSIMYSWLEKCLPSDAHVRCNRKLVVLTRQLPSFRMCRHTAWESKAQLIHTLVAAASPFRYTVLGGQYHTDCIGCKIADPHIVKPPLIVAIPTRESAQLLFQNGVETAHRVKRKMTSQRHPPALLSASRSREQRRETSCEADPTARPRQSLRST